MTVGLSQEFLSHFKGKQPEWGPVGWVVFQRTYSRWIEPGDVFPCGEPYENVGSGRYEEWWEVCRRVTEGNFALLPDDPTLPTEAERQAEMEQFYRMMFFLIGLPPGRGLWMMGTKYQRERGGAALNNCWNIDVRPQPYFEGQIPRASFPFKFAMNRLMQGGGVGYSAVDDFMRQFPLVARKVKLSLVCDPSHKDYEQLKDMLTQVPEIGKGEKVARLIVADSREGWCDALEEVIDAHFDYPDRKTVEHLIVDVSEVRGSGERIKGFGGTASGPKPLIAMLREVNSLLNTLHGPGKRMKTRVAVDIMNFIGRCIVAGNVRRSAEIAGGDPTNKSFVTMKSKKAIARELFQSDYTELVKKVGPEIDRKALYFVGAEWNDLKRPEFYAFRDSLEGQARQNFIDLHAMYEKADYEINVNHARWASNNSVVVDNNYLRNNVKSFNSVAKSMVENGEPGTVNIELMRHYGRLADGRKENCDPDVTFTNPCAEISLANGEPCNLFEVFPLMCDKYNIPYGEVLRLAARYVYRVTFAEYDWEVTQKIIAKNRRVGVSLSGIQDWILTQFGRSAIKGWRKPTEEECAEYGLDPKKVWDFIPIYDDAIVATLDHMYKVVDKTLDEYATALGTNKPIKLTTVKPSGTVAKLPGVSSGVHWHYAEYIIQRIRFSNNDPILVALKLCGYKHEPDYYTPNTTVVEFPVKQPSAGIPGFKAAGDVPVEEQLAMQGLLQAYWADNSVSCTINFREHEAAKIPMLIKYWAQRTKTISILPYDGHGYIQPPWEPITKEQYEEMKANIKGDVAEVYAIMQSITKIDDMLDLNDCVGGSCPVR